MRPPLFYHLKEIVGVLCPYRLSYGVFFMCGDVYIMAEHMLGFVCSTIWKIE